jgi:hypothetical protein
MSDLLFEMWLRANNFENQVWQAGLLRALKARFAKSQERLVIDGTGCQWPTRVYRVNQNENTPGI